MSNVLTNHINEDFNVSEDSFQSEVNKESEIKMSPEYQRRDSAEGKKQLMRKISSIYDEDWNPTDYKYLN